MSWYPLPLLWSGGCQNGTTGWEMTLSRFVRPCCGSFPSYFSWFLRNSAVAEAEGPFQDRNILPEEALLLRKKNTQPLLLGASLLLKKNHSVYQISSKGWGKWKKYFETASGALQHLFLQDMKDTGLLLAVWALWARLCRTGDERSYSNYILMLLLRRDATRCHPNSKEAIHLQKQQTLAIHWAVLKSLSKSSQN